MAFALPVAAETYDGFLNDINGHHVSFEHVLCALDAAKGGPIEEGSVGGGTGMITFGFKAGSGSSSRYVAWNGWTITVHLAESPAEMELLEHRSGPFREFLQSLNIWEPFNIADSVRWILWRTQRSPHVLFAHGNYLPPDNIDRCGRHIICSFIHFYKSGLLL
jgi:hypothetical protein